MTACKPRNHGYFSIPPCLAVCLVVIAASTQPVSAGVDYSLEGSIRLDEEFNSNIQLIPNRSNPKAVFGTNLGFNGTATAAAPNWKSWGKARFDNYFYSPLGNLDRQNQIIDAGYTYLTEQSKWDITGNFTSDAILATETDTINSGFLFPGLIGRELKSISPSLTYSVNGQISLNLGYSYAESKYSTPPGVLANFPDSVTHSANSGLSYRFNDQFIVTSNLSYTTFSFGQKTSSQFQSALSRSNFDSESSNSINYLSGMLGMTYAYDATTQLNLSAGGQYSTTETKTRNTITTTGAEVISFSPLVLSDVTQTTTVSQGNSNSQVVPIFGFGGTKKFENSEIQFNYSRQVSPSINGQLLTTDRLTLTSKHNFSKLITGNLNFSFLDQERPDGSQITTSGANVINQTFYSLRGELSYFLTPQWVLGAGYQYRLRDSGLTSGSFSGIQDAHSVFVNLRYDFEKLQF